MKKLIHLLLLLGIFILNGSSTLRPGKDFALFFAINQYDYWDVLANPISDVKSIAKDLEDIYGFKTEVVPNANRKAILDKIEEYRKKTYDRDAQLLIFFSGHGEFNEATKQGYFVPKNGLKSDAYGDSYIEYEGLKRRISSLPCDHILLALDACYSGTANESIAMRGKPGVRPGDNTDAARERYISTSLQYKTRLMLTSGAKVRTPDKSDFVAKFLEALRSQGGDDRLLNFPELLGFLTTASPKPVSCTFGEHAPGGEFLFIQKTYKVSEELAQKSKEVTAAEQDLAAWRIAKSTDTEAAYRNYLMRFPSGEFREQANTAILDIQTHDKAWEKAQNIQSIEAYQEYLNKFPDGSKRTIAMNEINKLEAALATRQDDLAWNIATEKNTLEAYKKYQRDYPYGRHRADAAAKVKSLETVSKPQEKKTEPISSKTGRTIRGTVMDKRGEPLIGATIVVKGTTTGTYSDIDGRYTVTLPPGVSQLEFWYVGYKTQVSNVGASNVLDVFMKKK